MENVFRYIFLIINNIRYLIFSTEERSRYLLIKQNEISQKLLVLRKRNFYFPKKLRKTLLDGVVLTSTRIRAPHGDAWK